MALFDIFQREQHADLEELPDEVANAVHKAAENIGGRTVTLTVTVDPRVVTSGDGGEWSAAFNYILAGTPGVDFSVDIPVIPRVFAVDNQTTEIATIQVVGAGGADRKVTLAPGKSRVMISDGVQHVDGLAPENQVFVPPFTIGNSGFFGKPAAAEFLVRYLFSEVIKFSIGLPNSQGYCGVTATAVADFDILQNAASIGTMSFAIGANTATFTFASAITFVVGARLEMTAPAVQDTTLADISWTLRGERP